MHSVSDSVSTRRANLIASVLLGLLIAVAIFACAPDPVPSAPAVVQAIPRPPIPVPVKSTAPVQAVVGSSRGKTYHRPDCEWALKINPSNKVDFTDARDAEQKGYKPCRTCCAR